MEYPPFDFIICSRQSASFVRVRRLRYATYDPGDILDSCAAEIAVLRGIPVSKEIGRELRARGPGPGMALVPGPAGYDRGDRG